MTTIKITLFKGRWGKVPTRDIVTPILMRAFSNPSARCYGVSVEAIRIRPPFDYEDSDEIYRIIHVDVDCGIIDDGDEVIGDYLFDALLRRLCPEYDSLLEVEQVEPLSV